MQMHTHEATLTMIPTMRAGAQFSYDDPLDADGPADEVMPTTRRELTRLALVAAETGARFQREGVVHDPMAWLLAPRRLFEGASAIEACLGREACIRALLVHGLGIGLDADPEEVDGLTRGEAGDDDEPACSSGEDGRWNGDGIRPAASFPYGASRYSA